MINSPALLDHTRKNPKPARDYFLAQLRWQLDQFVPIVLYCDTCCWGSSDDRYTYCPYGHGNMQAIGKFFSRKSLDNLLEGI